jgi:hypothetical protein
VPDRYDEDLVAELRELESWLVTPEPADQRRAVRDRLVRGTRRRRRIRATVAAVVAALAGTVVAVAPARAAVLDAVNDLLRVAGIVVQREDGPTALPPTPSPLPSQRTATLAEARRLARFPVALPAALGEPEQVVLSDPYPSGAPRVVTLVYRGGKVRLDQFDGRLDLGFYKKSGTAQWTEVGSAAAIWVPGEHPVTYIGSDGVERTATARLAGPTLVWADGLRTYRLEGFATLPEAMEVAVSVR